MVPNVIRNSTKTDERAAGQSMGISCLELPYRTRYDHTPSVITECAIHDGKLHIRTTTPHGTHNTEGTTLKARGSLATEANCVDAQPFDLRGHDDDGESDASRLVKGLDGRG